MTENKKQVMTTTIRMEKKLLMRFRHVCLDAGISMSEAIEQLVSEHMCKEAK